ncbi:hypothetical protein KAJ27_02870 [bacterium]|nr:hypothetical protein [bacterium]
MKKVLLVTVLVLFVFTVAAQAWPGQQFIAWGNGRTRTAAYNAAIKAGVARLQGLGFSDMRIVRKNFYIIIGQPISCRLIVEGIK